MSHEPDSNLGGFVKNIAKDVVSDLVSIPKEAARQAVGLPSENLDHDRGMGNGDMAQENERIRDELEQKLKSSDERLAKSQAESENWENEAVERTLIYQDRAGDRVAKEQRNEPAVVGPAVIQVQEKLQQTANVGGATQESHLLAKENEVKKSNEEVAQAEKDEVYEWLYKAVWQGYEA